MHFCLGPQKIRIAREAMRQSKRQGTAVLSKKQIEQVEYNTAIDAAVKGQTHRSKIVSSQFNLHMAAT